MYNDYRKAMLSILIPLLCAGVFLFLNNRMQPAPLKNESSFKTAVLSDIDEYKLYTLDGEIIAYPKVKLSPNNFDSYSGPKTTISSLIDIKSPEFIIGDNYVATIKMQLLLPKDIEYGIVLPGQFCEYALFCNGSLFYHSESYKHKNPCFPVPKYVALPYSETGYYCLFINLVTPINCDSSSYPTNLLGTYKNIKRVEVAERNVIYFLLSFVLFIIAACLIQMISLRNDKVLNSFLFFSIAALIRVLFSDNVIAVDLIGYLPYQVGTVVRGIMIPLFIFALTFHIYTIYEMYFPKYLLAISFVALLVPVVNGLTFSVIPALSILSNLCDFIPYGICLYVIYCAVKDTFFYSPTVILGLTSLLSGSIIDYITSHNTVPGKYTYTYGIIFISVAQHITLAKTYALQDEAELSMTAELNKQMEAMQGSENAFLNAQMKPHFLYNTLNTIADLCVTDAEKARQLISALKDYVAMVISLDNTEETVSLSKELKLARTYYKIEKERFPNIDFFEELPIRIPNIQMPPLVIQPLVENAIKHGVRKSSKSGVIIIRIKEKPDYVQFQVSDNGVGMTQEQIEKMFVVPKENKSVGIYNINKRLTNLYGSGLTVESTVNLGTCISFTIPKGKNTEHIKHGEKRIE